VSAKYFCDNPACSNECEAVAGNAPALVPSPEATWKVRYEPQDGGDVLRKEYCSQECIDAVDGGE